MKSHRWWMSGLLAALAIAALLSPFASRWPDGLGRVAEQLGFRNRERPRPIVAAPLAEYQLPGARGASWSTPAAGVAGTLIVFGASCLLGYALTRRRAGG